MCSPLERKKLKFTAQTMIGKDVDMIRGHLHNVKVHAGFDRLTCEKELVVIVYTNPSIPKPVTDEIISVCKENDARAVLFPEPHNTFIENLYAGFNLAYDSCDEGWILRSGSDTAYNYDCIVKLYDLATRTREQNKKVVYNLNAIEHSIRAMSQGNISRHILGNFGDTFQTLNVKAFDAFVAELNKGVDKELLTVEECMAIWGKPTPFYSTLGYINRTEAVSWLMTKEDWKLHGPFRSHEGITGDCYLHDLLHLAGYQDYCTRDCVSYHFFRGESSKHYS